MSEFAGIKCTECGEEYREAPGYLVGGICFACLERICAWDVRLVAPCDKTLATHRYATNIKWGAGYDPVTGMRYIRAPSTEAARWYLRLHSVSMDCLQTRTPKGDWIHDQHI